jgi:large subunit ribosomal protein L4
MKLPIKTFEGASQGEHESAVLALEGTKGVQAVHDVVVAYQAAQRSGTACTKTMGEVHGSGKKPWRQKGTGRARAGSFASPLWRGGGVVFGPKPRDFTKKVSQKTRQLALRKALVERAKAGNITLLEDLKLGSPRTSQFVGALAKLGVTGTVLIVTSGVDRNLALASRNVATVEVTTGAQLHTYQVLRSDSLLITREAMETVENRLKN